MKKIKRISEENITSRDHARFLMRAKLHVTYEIDGRQ